MHYIENCQKSHSEAPILRNSLGSMKVTEISWPSVSTESYWSSSRWPPCRPTSEPCHTETAQKLWYRRCLLHHWRLLPGWGFPCDRRPTAVTGKSSAHSSNPAALPQSRLNWESLRCFLKSLSDVIFSGFKTCTKENSGQRRNFPCRCRPFCQGAALSLRSLPSSSINEKTA
jgi:hypothetical protein